TARGKLDIPVSQIPGASDYGEAEHDGERHASVFDGGLLEQKEQVVCRAANHGCPSKDISDQQGPATQNAPNWTKALSRHDIEGTGGSFAFRILVYVEGYKNQGDSRDHITEP